MEDPWDDYCCGEEPDFDDFWEEVDAVVCRGDSKALRVLFTTDPVRTVLLLPFFRRMALHAQLHCIDNPRAFLLPSFCTPKFTVCRVPCTYNSRVSLLPSFAPQSSELHSANHPDPDPDRLSCSLTSNWYCIFRAKRAAQSLRGRSLC
jgi:hypothetical protein